MEDLRLTIYNEFVTEQKDDLVKKIYPKGIHEAIGEYMRKEPGFHVKTATLEMPDHGLTEEVLDSTDVLMWFGHIANDKVRDEIVDGVHRRVLDGMGLVAMHSAFASKIFKRLMGTSCCFCARDARGAGDRERLWVVNPSHPITQGIGAYLELPNTEMYGEYFDIPNPDELIFISWYEGGEVFRSGAVWHRGRGRIFYFSPGHETYPIFHNKQVLRILANAVRWAKFSGNIETMGIGRIIQVEPREVLSKRDYKP